MKLRESARLDAIAAALGRHPHVLVRRRQVGLFLAVNWGSASPARVVEILDRAGIGARVVEIGCKGEPDLDVIIGGQVCGVCQAPVHPMPGGCEVKSDTGRQSPDQIVYQRDVSERRGILYVLAREPAEACKAFGLSFPR